MQKFTVIVYIPEDDELDEGHELVHVTAADLQMVMIGLGQFYQEERLQDGRVVFVLEGHHRDLLGYSGRTIELDIEEID